jgi:hypothetical protein
MSEIPADVIEAGCRAGIALRLAIAETQWRREAGALWACPGVIEQMNEAFAAALLAEREAATARERERAAAIGYRVCAETRHVTLGDKVAAAIRSPDKDRGEGNGEG